MEEIWKDIPDFDGYQASNLGNIRSHKYKLKGKIFKYQLDKYGYYRVCLFKNKKILKGVHQLIALTFIPNPLNKPCVNHINGVKTDNRIENLEWCTVRENTIHSYKMGLQVPTQKQKESARKMCLETKSKKVCLIDENNNILKEWNSITNASKELNIPSSCISRVCKNKRITTHKMKFMYK